MVTVSVRHGMSKLLEQVSRLAVIRDMIWVEPPKTSWYMYLALSPGLLAHAYFASSLTTTPVRSVMSTLRRGSSLEKELHATRSSIFLKIKPRLHTHHPFLSSLLSLFPFSSFFFSFPISQNLHMEAEWVPN